MRYDFWMQHSKTEVYEKRILHDEGKDWSITDTKHVQHIGQCSVQIMLHFCALITHIKSINIISIPYLYMNHLSVVHNHCHSHIGRILQCWYRSDEHHCNCYHQYIHQYLQIYTILIHLKPIYGELYYILWIILLEYELVGLIFKSISYRLI